MADPTLKSMVEQMEKRYQALSIQLESYREIHAEMTTLARAIKVLKGEKLTPGRWGGLETPQATEEDTDYLQPPSKLPAMRSNGTVQDVRQVLHQILKANSKGMSIREMSAALLKKGYTVNNVGMHNALRPFKNNLKVVGHEGIAKIYALTKEG